MASMASRWNFMECHGIPWNAMDVMLFPWHFSGIIWLQVECHGIPWDTEDWYSDQISEWL